MSEYTNYQSAQRRYDNLLPEDFEQVEMAPVKRCKTCENYFHPHNPRQHVCHECEGLYGFPAEHGQLGKDN